MKNEETSIHAFDLNLICEYFLNVPRQGPGDDLQTEKALSFMGNNILQSKSAKIADIGCGTGTPTMVLAKNTQGEITGVDLFAPFINKLNQKAKNLGFENRVKGIVKSMDDLPFEKESLDLILCEGAIYNIGFKKGIKYFGEFLKSKGYMAISESSWLTHVRPLEIENWWQKSYSEIATISEKIAIIEQTGFKLIAAFTLPDLCWTNNYYLPQQKAKLDFLKKYPENETAKMLVKNQRYEAEMFKKYHQYYGYVFYIIQKA